MRVLVFLLTVGAIGALLVALSSRSQVEKLTRDLEECTVERDAVRTELAERERELRQLAADRDRISAEADRYRGVVSERRRAFDTILSLELRIEIGATSAARSATLKGLKDTAIGAVAFVEGNEGQVLQLANLDLKPEFEEVAEGRFRVRLTFEPLNPTHVLGQPIESLEGLRYFRTRLAPLLHPIELDIAREGLIDSIDLEINGVVVASGVRLASSSGDLAREEATFDVSRMFEGIGAKYAASSEAHLMKGGSLRTQFQ